jgi:hypothetical protein
MWAANADRLVGENGLRDKGIGNEYRQMETAEGD